MSDYSNPPRQVVPAPVVVPPSAGAIFFAARNLQPSQHPALQNGNAGGAVDTVAAVSALIAALPNQAR
jgi:hypothetical protein